MVVNQFSNYVNFAPHAEIGAGSGLVAGNHHINTMQQKEQKEPKKKWIFVDNEETDSIKNRPEWSTEKERDEVVFEPKPPNPLEDWINKK